MTKSIQYNLLSYILRYKEHKNVHLTRHYVQTLHIIITSYYIISYYIIITDYPLPLENTKYNLCLYRIEAYILIADIQPIHLNRKLTMKYNI